MNWVENNAQIKNKIYKKYYKMIMKMIRKLQKGIFVQNLTQMKLTVQELLIKTIKCNKMLPT